MNGRTDVIDELRRANPVPDEQVDGFTNVSAAQLRAALRQTSVAPPTMPVEAGTVPQPPRWWSYAAAAAVIAIGGVAVAVAIRGSSDPASTVTHTTTSTTTEAVATAPAQLLPNEGDLEPGSYYFGADPEVEPLGVSLTVPDGWYSAADGGVVAKHDDADRMVVGMWSVGSIYTDPCHWLGTSIRPEPSVDDIVAAFVDHRETPPPVDVVVDGYQGKRITLQVPATIDFADCDGGEFRSWTDSAGGVRYHQGPGQIDELLIVDVDGVPLLIDVHHFPEAADDELAEQQQVVDSIRIDPAATRTPSDTTTAAAATSFAAALESASLLINPSAEEVALASDSGDFQPMSGPTQVLAADTFVSLHTCRPSPFYPSTCTPTEWAYTTGSVDGGVEHRGLLGEADRPELYVLDDRFVVAMEISPGSRRAPNAWLIDSVSGGYAELTWRDEPTTISAPEQSLVIFDDPSTVTSMWAEEPIERFLPRVVDARDGTIRPLAVPDNALADLPVAHSGHGQIWIGTTPDGRDLGVAYSDDGGATWTEVTLPAQLPGDTTDLATSASNGFELLSIAADGDRIAATVAWSSDNDRYVYVSGDAGLNWSTVTVASPELGANGLHLYPLADKQLLLVRSADVYSAQLLVSTGSDWTTLEEHPQATRATTNKSFSVNRAGTVYTLETESNTGHASNTDFSADLTNWRTIPVPDE